MATRTENIRFNVYLNDHLAGKTTGELYKNARVLRAEINKLEIGSEKWIRKMGELKGVQSDLSMIRGELKGQKMSWSKMADGFNKYFGIITAMVASFTGVILSFRKAVDDFNLFEERVDNLQALTGLAGRQLEWLANSAKEMSKAVVEGGVRIKQSADKIVDAFTKVGSQRPELLKNKDALHAVTQDAIILSEAAKTQLQPATEALTTTMNQFNAQASDSRRIINAIAAGSKAGAADIPYLSKAIEKSGTTMNLMNISLEQGIGLIEAVAPKYKQAETAGNSLDKVLLKMKAKNIGFVNGVFDMNVAIDELSARFANGESATKIFGEEHAKMAEILVQAKSEFNRYTKAVTDTNVAIEQATINTDNNAAKLQQAKNRFQLLRIELGEKLAPALTFSTNGMTYFIKALMAAPAFIRENQVLIIALVGAFIAYNAERIRMIALTTKSIAIEKLAILVNKNQLLIVNAQAIAARAKILLTGKATIAQKRAIITQKALNSAMKANPAAWLVVGITALVAAVKLYDKFSASAKRREEEKKILTDQLAEANNHLGETYKALSKKMSELNTLSISEKQALKDKIAKTIELAEAELVLLEAKKQQVVESSSELTAWQKLKNYVVGFGSVAGKAYLDAKDSVNNAVEAGKKFEEPLNNLRDKLENLKNTQVDLDKILNAEQIGDAIGSGTLVELEEKLQQYQVALKNAALGSEEFYRIQNKINEVQKQMSSKQSYVSDEDIKKRKVALVDLAKMTEKLMKDQLIAKMTDDEKELQQVKDKYDKEIEIVKGYLDKKHITQLEYDAQMKELEKLKDQELQDLKLVQAEENEKELREKIYETRQKYNLILDEENRQLELEALKTDLDNKLLTHEEHEKAKAEINKKYEKKKADKIKESAEAELKAFSDKVQKQMAIVNAFGDFFAAAKDLELEKAGENEAKKKAIMKKYAVAELLVTGGKIIANTAEAAMKAIAQLGPIAGPIAAAVIGVTGALQLGVVAAQKSKIMGYSEGGHTGYGGKDEVAGLVHKDEYVIPKWMRQMPAVADMEGMLENIRTRGYSEGGATTTKEIIREIPGSSDSSETNAMLIAAISGLIQKLDQPLEAKGVWEWENYKKGHDRMTKLQDKSGDESL